MNDRKLQRERLAALIAEQEKSGLSVSEFCRQHNIKAHVMHHYRYQLKKKQSLLSQSTLNEKRLIPVQIKSFGAVESTSSEIRLIASNGLQCILSSDTEVMRIKQIAEALMSC